MSNKDWSGKKPVSRRTYKVDPATSERNLREALTVFDDGKPDPKTEKQWKDAIYRAVVGKKVQKLKNWFERFGDLFIEKLNAFRRNKIKNLADGQYTILHVAIQNPDVQVFQWLIDRVSMDLLERNEPISPYAMIESRIEHLKVSNDSFEDSVTRATGNSKEIMYDKVVQDEIGALESMKERLGKALTHRIRSKFMGLAIEHGSLVGVEMVHKHFPDVFDHMEHHTLLDHVERADELGHSHIAEYISAQLE
jgi:hypothetical protein